FRWFDLERSEPLDLVQTPILVHDGALLRTDALELGVELAHVVLRELLDRIAEVGGAAVLVFHPNNLARQDFLGLFRAAVDYGLEHGAGFAWVRDLARWWRERESAAER